MKYLFGPVPSRRLGLSLGIDLVPSKICSLNCIYCECGRTDPDCLTVLRQDYLPITELITEINQLLTIKPKLDYITLTGSGEPTLNIRLGEIISFLKVNYPQYKIALLTNSTLLGDAQVRADILPVDLLVPSLDAVSENLFQKINKPCPGLSAESIINNLIDFSQQFKGHIWLEVFIVAGLNDHVEELSLIKEKCRLINPDIIHLNTLDRPPAFDHVNKPTRQQMEEIRDFFAPLPVKIIAKYVNQINERKNDLASYEEISNKIIAILRRRPSTLNDLSLTLEIDEKSVQLYIDQLKFTSRIKSTRLERGEFFYLCE